MSRATWRGSFRLGNLIMPVKLFAATKPTDPDFTLVHQSDMAPVKRQSVCSVDGKVLKADEIARAIEHNGTYVDITSIDVPLSHVERDIIVRQFATPSHVHSLYYDKPYYLAPELGGEMAYAILRNALKKANKIAVVTYSTYGKAHLGIIGPSDGIMILQQLKYATELMPRRDIKIPSLPQPSPAQIDLAVNLIEKYTTDFYLDDYRNEQLDSLVELIEQAKKGIAIARPKDIAPEVTPENKLTSTLRHLLEGNEKKLV